MQIHSHEAIQSAQETNGKSLQVKTSPLTERLSIFPAIRMLLFVCIIFPLYSGLVRCEPRPAAMKTEGKTMQVTVERTGGFTGIPLTKTVDTATLSQQEAIRLHQMMAAADFFKLPSTIPSIPQPDRFQYQITVEQEGKLHSVAIGEAAVPANLKTLLDWVMAQPAQPKL